MTNMIDMEQDDESLEKESPILHSISKENPFSVPENYFDSLPSEILEKCRTEAEPQKWGEGFFTTLLGYKWRLLAVTGCVAVVCLIVLSMNNRPVSYEAMVENIPDSVIVEHLDRNITDINISTLEDIEGTENSSAVVKKIADSTNTDQDIIAYLMNNNVSVSDIENE